MELFISEMMAMQEKLQKQYDWWVAPTPSRARDMLLWSIVEAGEAADIIKKWGDEAIVKEEEPRRHFAEEIGDTFMYLMDVLRCYEIPAEDLCAEYSRKWARNMTRWEKDPSSAAPMPEDVRSDLGLTRMLDMQVQLQEKYFSLWGGLQPHKGRDCLLWGIIEAGEAADIIKKWGDEAIMKEEEPRRHFTEEIGDFIMFLLDVLICYGIGTEEFSAVYREKWSRNMTRWE